MTINFQDDEWELISKGVVRSSETFVHLASKTRGSHQHNGFNPVQIATFIPSDLLGE